MFSLIWDHLVSKTWIACLIVVGTNVLGNYALARGLHNFAVDSVSPISYIKAMFHPWTALGIFAMIAWFTSRLALLSWADLSYVMPISSASYLITAVVGVVELREHVTPMHWAGIVIITLGVLLVAVTYPETGVQPESKH
jgi:drug/metabolite transporter (DMT)-like permease